MPEHFFARLYWFCVCDRVADLETQPSEGLALNSWVLCSDASARRPPCECDLAVLKETQLLVKAPCNLRRTRFLSLCSTGGAMSTDPGVADLVERLALEVGTGVHRVRTGSTLATLEEQILDARAPRTAEQGKETVGDVFSQDVVQQRLVKQMKEVRNVSSKGPVEFPEPQIDSTDGGC